MSSITHHHHHHHHHLVPYIVSFLFASSPSLSDLKRAHAVLVVSGAALRKPTGRRLVALYCLRSPASAAAPLVAAHLRSPDPVASNLALKSIVRRSRPRDAIAFFCRAANPVGCRPSRCTFPLLVTAAKLCDSIDYGELFHCFALKLGFLSHLPIPNSLIHMYASCGCLDLARQMFDEMPERDRVSYNSLLDGYVKSGGFDEAERLFWSMPNRSVVSWSTLFNGYVRNRMFQKGLWLFHQMQELGVEPDDCSIITLLSVFAHFKLAVHGKMVHGFLHRKWLRIPTHVSSALVDFYCKIGSPDGAVVVFERAPKKDLISWNALISGLGSSGRGAEALSFFSRMLHDGVKPDDITFIGVLVACGHSGLVEEGLRYFGMMSSVYGIKPSFAHHWCLVDLFVRVQRPDEALKVIQNMPWDGQSAVWGAVIWLAKVQGDISVGEYLGKRLIELEPDNSRRYVPLVNLYAAASKWDKYKELQEVMKERGLKKLPDCTLIDLNVVVHKFLVGDKSRPEIGSMYEVLEEIGKQLKLQPPAADENDLVRVAQ
ncbi:Pentatricopeptide repeat-containing protein [Ananas comosus]|uniref:Pentatricopeptide repeat-containing protein n=1 Tax=Ananas comosus TaxID=4615 RepID=A0A199W3P7_ANACO|nr:Pentatricopeptide repeat-containing protein [Ananas comosus]